MFLRMTSTLVLLVFTTGCASYWQASRLEEQMERLIQSTNRATLSEIFGQQADQITRKMDSLSGEERERLDEILSNWERGSASLEDVRTSVLSTLGGGEREVASTRGIWVRDEDGNKLSAIARGTKLVNCKKLGEDDLPETITDRKSLMSYSWGSAQLGDETVVFPWELTISSFTMEIVENTARRTAEEFIKMGGEKAWTRPIKIQIVTDDSNGNLKIKHDTEEGEIYVNSDVPTTPPAQN